MNLIIQDKNQLKLAELDISPDGKVLFHGNVNSKFRHFVENEMTKGILETRDIYDPNTNSFALVARPAKKTDSNYSLAVKRFLEASGYEVVEKDIEVEEEIKKLLAEFPDDNQDKVDILKRLPDMSYLEQTAILEGLKEITKI